jgi:hypothetical protein
VLLLLGAAGLPLDSGHIAGSLAATTLALFRLARRRGPLALGWPRWHPSRASVSWLLLPTALGFGSIALLVVLEPLSGLDHGFRWDFLARQMWRLGTLDFYPAVAPADFLHYPWCDGIAPLVAGQYLWSYFARGEPVASATAPAVLLQAAVLFLLVFRTAEGLAGRRGGWTAVALLAGSGALLWGVAIGQETGLTAIAVVAIFHFIARHRAEPERPWLVWAGVAAAVGALAREYGLVFVALGALGLVGAPCTRRDALVYLGTTAALAWPWYLRNTLRTGNPLYSHEVAGLFPSNPVHLDFMQAIAEETARQPNLGFRTGSFFLLTGVTLVAGVGGGWRHFRARAAMLAAIAAIGLLWWWSVGHTAGGFVYSLRVLTPALALAAVAGGCWLASVTGPRATLALAAVLTVAAGDAAMRALYLPFAPRVTWWTQPLPEWRQFQRWTEIGRNDPNWDRIAAAAHSRQIVANDPTVHATLTTRGAATVPLFSPEVRFLFAAHTDPAGGMVRLRAAGVRFLVLTRNNDFSDLHLGRARFFRELKNIPPTFRSSIFDLYDLDAPPWLPAAPSPPTSQP